ncbi:MAG: amino acid oxidase, partial [Phenylobacterium sp.]|nr:amino acid oxidase [Phenylobacterium sp.]
MGGSGAASVIVVGAGVFGLATGLALAEAGLKVRL